MYSVVPCYCGSNLTGIPEVRANDFGAGQMAIWIGLTLKYAVRFISLMSYHRSGFIRVVQETR